MLQKITTLTPQVYRLVSGNQPQKTSEGSQVTTFIEVDRERFELPPVIFGKMIQRCEIMISRYLRTNKTNCGVLMAGLPGTGKSMFSEFIANVLIQNGVPCIYISGTIVNDQVLKYLKENCTDPCCIYIDEFEKLVKWEKQDQLLSILSDSSSKKFWILTVNDTHRISDAILSRPGRIRYKLDFDKLPLDVITEYCEYHKVEKEFLESIIDVYPDQRSFSYDHLQALVTEHLDTNLPLEDIKTYINIVGLDSKLVFRIKDFTCNGKEMDPRVTNSSYANKDERDHFHGFKSACITSNKFRVILDNLRAKPNIAIDEFNTISVFIKPMEIYRCCGLKELHNTLLEKPLNQQNIEIYMSLRQLVRDKQIDLQNTFLIDPVNDPKNDLNQEFKLIKLVKLEPKQDSLDITMEIIFNIGCDKKVEHNALIKFTLYVGVE